jgi:hypothetical protein
VVNAQLASYHDLIARKRVAFEPRGLATVPALNAAMFPHQAHGTEFALRCGCAALFYDTGLGKSLMALDWGRIVVEYTNRPVLMLAPLAVGPQHQREAAKFGIDARHVREAGEVREPRIYITNYERLDRFDPALFSGVILDESSILKSYTGKTTRWLIETFARTPYRLACTATPAPNDHTEIGTHAAFLGAMRRDEMLSRWFIHDSADTGTWRIKGHAVRDFWQWVASWARAVAKPSDLGFRDDGFVLPELVVHHHEVRADTSVLTGHERDGQARLFRIPDTSATSIHAEKRLTVAARADRIAELVAAEPTETWVVWTDTDYEADALTERIPKALEVRGSMPADKKEARLDAFARQQVRILVTKPSIAGYGLNLQHCARQAFVGLSFSYENFYQAIRRCWRFGQLRPVHVHVACSDTERSVWDVVSRKQDDHGTMKREMTAAMRAAASAQSGTTIFNPSMEAGLPAWMCQ